MNSRLIDQAYAGIDETQPWRGFIGGLADELDAHDVSLIAFSRRLHRFHYHITTDREGHWDAAALQGVMQASYVLDITAPQAASEADWGRIPAFSRSALFQRHLAPIDVVHMLMQDVYSADDVVWRLVATRTSRHRAFGRAEKTALELCGLHLERAIGLRRRIESADAVTNTLLDLADSLQCGCMVVDADKKVLADNATAQILLDGGSGVSVERGVLRFDGAGRHAIAQALDSAIAAHLEQRRTQAPIAIEKLGPQQLKCVVKPLFAAAERLAFAQPAAALLIENPGMDNAASQIRFLRELHGLSQREAELAALLTEGYSAAEAAALRGVSITTVKTHIRSLYQKLGIHRRAQLVALLSQNTPKLV